MDNCYCDAHGRFFVLLTDLEAQLKARSHDDEQWKVVRVPGMFFGQEGQPIAYVLLGYSNPDPCGPNMLSYVLPMVVLAGSAREEPQWLVCFSASTITPVTRGLYFEDGNLYRDSMEDFDRVWTALKQDLCRDLKPQPSVRDHSDTHHGPEGLVAEPSIHAARQAVALTSHLICLANDHALMEETVG